MKRRWMPKFVSNKSLRTRKHEQLRPQLNILDDRIVPTVFTNTNSILLPQDQIGGAGVADLYPSTITASGLSGVVKSLTVTLNGLSHTSTKDLDVLLVGPSGQAVKIMSDTGGSGNGVSGINLTFDDAAADFLPTGTGSSYNASGTFKPTDFDDGTDTFPGYTGTPSLLGLNKTFRNTDGNGVWSLRIVDDAGTDVGQLTGGWSIDIISRVNTAPVGVADSYITSEDGTLNVSAANGVLLGTGKDTDAESDTLTATLVSGPTNGTLTFNADGSFDYTPFLDFSGTDSFTYRPDDGFTEGSLGTVTITVTPQDDAPIAVDDYYVAAKSTTLVRPASLGLLANDLHADTATRITLLNETFEAVTLQDYTPANVPGLVAATPGTDDWSPNLPTGWSAVATASDKLSPLTNEPTEFRGWRIHNIDSWYAHDNQSRDQFTLGGVGKGGRVLVADGDEYADGGAAAPYYFAVQTRAIDLRGVMPNSAKLEFDSSFRPENFDNQIGKVNVSYDGGATFTQLLLLDSAYTAGGVGNLNKVNERIALEMNNPVGKTSAILQFEYTAGNDWWWAIDDVEVTGARTSRTGLTATLGAAPLNGTLNLNADGSFNYTPTGTFTGTDSFTYTLSDGITTTAPATVLINVRDGNPNLPVANNDNYTTLVNQPFTIASNFGLLANDTDADGDPLAVVQVGTASLGTLNLNPDGSFTYTPNLNTGGIDTITYKANDVFGNSNTASLIITIGAPPVIAGGDTAAYSVAENNVPPTVVGTISAVVDPGFAPVYSITGGADAAYFTIDAANGKLSLNKAVNFELPGDVDENNTYIVVVRATDNIGRFDSQTVTLTVTDVTEAFELLSNGGGATGTARISEHNTAVTTVVATPAVGTTYAIVGGVDKNLFAIDPPTGKVTFISAPDFESPTDANLDNNYEVIVQAMNGSNMLPQALTVTVLDVVGPESAKPDTYSTQKANSLIVAAPGVLANDSTRITLFSEGFEGLTMKPFRTGSYVGKGDGTDFSLDAPGNWTKVTKTQGGALLTDADPPVEYRGWVALDVDSWFTNQGQERNAFTRAGVGQRGTALVADGDTFANADGSGLANKGYLVDFTINMPQISLAGTADNSARVEFDSSFRPEGAQAGKIEYSLDGGAFTTLLTLDNTYAGGGGGGLAKVNERLTFDIPNAGNSTLDIRLNYIGGNDWWWAVDNVVVSAQRAGHLPGTAVLVSGPNNGTLVGGLNPDGSFTYNPNPTFVGKDTIQYKVFDGVGFTPTTTVTLDVLNPRNIVWTGAVDGNWDINTTANWDASGATTYKQADIPLFNDVGLAKNTVQLNTTVNPGTVTVNTTGAYTIQGTGKISGAAGLNLVNGSLTLATVNDFTGPTTIAAGSTLQLGAGGATGSIVGPITNNGSLVFNRTGTSNYGNIAGTGTITQSAGTLALTGVSSPSAVTVNGTGFLQVVDGTTIGAAPITFATAGTRFIVTGTGATFTNPISLPNATGQIRITTPNNTNTTLNGIISGGGSGLEWFVQASTSGNSGSLTLNGANTFQGKLNNQRGPLILGHPTAAGSALIFLDTNLNPAGDIQLAGNFTIANNIFIQSGAVNKFAVAAGLSAGMSGTIASSGTQGFEKVGDGVLTISGNNTFQGVLNASAGTLIVNGTNTPSGSTIGAAATLGGIGTIKAVAVAGTITGATDGTAGTLNTGNLTVTGSYKSDILSNSSADKLSVIGTVDITGSTLSLNVPNAITPGTQFTIIDNDSTDTITGKFANLPNEGDTITAGGQTFSISYVGGSDNNDVVLTRQGAATPVVSGIVVNDGAQQRSRLTKVVVNFASPVDLAQFSAPGAVFFTRTNVANNNVEPLGTLVDLSNGLVIAPASGTGSSITLTFQNIDNVGLDFGSLSDGRWSLSVVPASYVGNAGNTGNDLRRLFGDFDNNGTVDGTDFGFFPPFGSAVGSPFDFNNNNDIDSATDFSNFGNRIGVTL